MIPVELTSLVTATSLPLNGHRRHFSGESDVLEFGVFPGTPFCTHMEVSDNGGYPQIIQNHAAYRVMRSFGAGQATQLQFWHTERWLAHDNAIEYQWNSMKCPIQIGIIYQARSDNYHKRRTGSVPSRAPRCHALWHPPARSTATPGMLCTSRSCGIWIASDRISMERHGKFAPQWLWYQWWSMVVKNVWNRSGQIWSDKSSLPFPFWGQIGQIVSGHGFLEQATMGLCGAGMCKNVGARGQSFHFLRVETSTVAGCSRDVFRGCRHAGMMVYVSNSFQMGQAYKEYTLYIFMDTNILTYITRTHTHTRTHMYGYFVHHNIM